MNKKQFFDDRTRYLSFTQNTNEKIKFCELVFPYIKNISDHKNRVAILDAGTGDGSITANIIKAFHHHHPGKLLAIFGKEISFKDLKNTLDKLADRFVEHQKLLVTLTNVKFSEIHQLHKGKKVNGKNIKFLEIELLGCTSFDFQTQIVNAEVMKFITKFWGIISDNSGRTQYTNPCVITISRKDCKEVLFSNGENTKLPSNFDLIISSQAYRSRSTPERKVKYVISPLMQLLNDSGRLLITHSIGGKQICDILKIAFNNINAFPSIAKDLIYQLEKEPKNDDYQYDYSEPFSYEFNYTNTPSGSSSELFGREADAKIEALLYFAQITDQEINALNQCSNKILKLRESIQRHSELTFINEFFTVEKSKID